MIHRSLLLRPNRGLQQWEMLRDSEAVQSNEKVIFDERVNLHLVLHPVKGHAKSLEQYS